MVVVVDMGADFSTSKMVMKELLVTQKTSSYLFKNKHHSSPELNLNKVYKLTQTRNPLSTREVVIRALTTRWRPNSYQWQEMNSPLTCTGAATEIP